MSSERDEYWMQRAVELAARGRGSVEPNPLVGCVIVASSPDAPAAERQIGAGWHQRFGGAHAEIEALRSVAADDLPLLSNATLYVTLEPCCHHGKTPPCVDALIARGIRRVVMAQRDPFPAVDGGGIARLQASGITCELGILEAAARHLNAPYLTRVTQARPWFIAKWAITLDGKIATHTGHSRWISQPASRALVHELRGRVDAIVVGRGTVERDDPLLTARPAGPRIAHRVVLDRQARLSTDRQLVRTARDVPTLLVVEPSAPEDRLALLRAAGCEVWCNQASGTPSELPELAAEMARRGWTNVLLESGPTLLGAFHDAQFIDEVHVFIAPKIVGGATAPAAIGGIGITPMTSALSLVNPRWQIVDGDAYFTGHVDRTRASATGSAEQA